jgi:hypothetical protein
MLKGWNKKVRITSAINKAWMTTRTVSPNPLSDFVPDVTLIAFPIPRCDSSRGGRAFLHANRCSLRVKKAVPDSDVESQSRRKPEFAFALMQSAAF